jgi:hypothetical protein
VLSLGCDIGLRAVSFECDPYVELKRSFVEHGAGGVVGSGAMTSIIETAIFGVPDGAGSVVRLERGTAVGDDVTLTMKRSLVDSSRDAGVELSDVGADIEHSVIRDTAGLVGDSHTASRSGCAGQGRCAPASSGLEPWMTEAP